jgi:hypothetical protein
MNETENQIRLRRAKEALSAAKEIADNTRRALIDADSSFKRAREKYEELFLIEEQEECKRRKERA